MRCKPKVSVNMKFQDGQTVKLTKILYVPQAVKKLLSLSRLVSKGATMWVTKDKIIIKKNCVTMILDARKGQNKRVVLYLKLRRYDPEGQEILANMSEQEKGGSDKRIMV